MIDIVKEMFENKTFEELKELNKMSGEPYIPKSKEEFDEMMKCWLPESDVPEKYWKMKKKVLYLPLKKEWFEMIASGKKTEEYRLMNDFWTKRICSKAKDGSFECSKEKFSYVEFTLGYPKKDDISKRMRFEISAIYPQKGGNPEWGANPDEMYFVIKLGNKIEMGD